MTKSAPKFCHQCAAPLPENAPGGLCPRCLMAQIVAPTHLENDVAPRPSPTLEDLAPHFPQLEILECLGRGGMGVVYKARQKSLNRLVALKLLAPERADDPQFAARFEKEAHALAALNHPHIVGVHDFGKAGGYFYLLMEFVDGVNLRQAMKAGRFTPEQALAVVPPVCEALQYAHEHGIVHRDIKPENLLMDKGGRVKIADFGIAKMLGGDATAAQCEGASTGFAASESTMASVAGTPQYMAPEQKVNGATDHRADIYSLGVVLYEMLTGELPADRLQPPSRKVQIDVRLDEIVLRALEKSPELRYQTAGDFRTQVQTIVGVLPGAEKPSSPRAIEPVEVPARNTWLPYIGLIAILSGSYLTYIAWHDPVEGRTARPAGVFIAVVGLFLMLRGLLQVAGARRVDLTSTKPASLLAHAGNSENQTHRFSRTATWGACWAPLFFVFFLLYFTQSGKVSAGEYHGPPLWLKLAALILGGLGITAPFGTTILGWIAVGQIRRSAGKLHGMGLALFDGLFFPLLALDGLLGWLWTRVVYVVMTQNSAERISELQASDPNLANHILNAQQHSAATIGLVGTVIIAIVADFLIIRRVWRAVNTPLGVGQTGDTPPSSPPSAKGGEKSTFGKLAFGLFLAGVLGTPILLLFSKRNEEPALLFGAVAVLLSLIFGLMSRRDRYGRIALIGNGVLAVLACVSFVVFSFKAQTDREAIRGKMQPEMERERQARSQHMQAEFRARLRNAITSDFSARKIRFDDLSIVLAPNLTTADVTFTRLKRCVDGNYAEVGVPGTLKLKNIGGGRWDFKGGGALEDIAFEQQLGDIASSPSNGAAHNPRPLAEQGGSEVAHFGSIIKCFIATGKTNQSFYSIERGGYVDAPRELPQIPRFEDQSAAAKATLAQYAKWFADNDVDFLIQHAQGKENALALADMVVRPVLEKQFENSVPELMEAFKDNLAANHRLPLTPLLFNISSRSDALDTAIFKTRKGRIGILQVTSVSDNPRGVHVRYKLVQSSQAKSGLLGRRWIANVPGGLEITGPAQGITQTQLRGWLEKHWRTEYPRDKFEALEWGDPEIIAPHDWVAIRVKYIWSSGSRSQLGHRYYSFTKTGDFVRSDYVDGPERTLDSSDAVFGPALEWELTDPMAFNGAKSLLLETADWEKMSAADVATRMAAAEKIDIRANANSQPYVDLGVALKALLAEGKPATPLPQSLIWAFKKPDGEAGILQVIGFTQNPHGLKVRTKLGIHVAFDFGADLNPESKAAMLELLKLEGSGIPAPDKGNFGPTVERVVSPYEVIDLDTGKVMPNLSPDDGPITITDNNEKNTAEQNTRMRKRGVDAIAVGSQQLWGLDLKLRLMPRGSSDITPEQLAAALNFDVNVPAPESVIRQAIPAPAVFAFQTREGGMGLLINEGPVGDNSGVKIRYKLVSPTAESPARPVAKPADPLPAIELKVAQQQLDKVLADLQAAQIERALLPSRPGMTEAGQKAEVMQFERKLEVLEQQAAQLRERIREQSKQ